MHLKNQFEFIKICFIQYFELKFNFLISLTQFHY